MLMEDKIRKHKYFQAIRMKNTNLIDPLTKTLTRVAVTQYVEYLIRNNIRFSLGVMDIDNFKKINDTMGHQIGDEILSTVSDIFMTNIPEDAFVGRFGGDEFIYVQERESRYENLNLTFDNLYSKIRQPITVSTKEVVNCTATTGICRYPQDGSTYDELFSICDKCLYLGKGKGRNCYTIYVDYLYKDVKNSRTKTMSERVMDLYDIFNITDKRVKAITAMEYLTKELNITGIAYFNKGKLKVSYEKNDIYGKPAPFPEDYITRNGELPYIQVSDSTQFDKIDPAMHKFCYENNYLSYILYPVKANDKVYGYVLFYDSDYKRLWQDNDIALFTIYVKAVAIMAMYGGV